jgi:hypothetical protein
MVFRVRQIKQQCSGFGTVVAGCWSKSLTDCCLQIDRYITALVLKVISVEVLVKFNYIHQATLKFVNEYISVLDASFKTFEVLFDLNFFCMLQLFFF